MVINSKVIRVEYEIMGVILFTKAQRRTEWLNTGWKKGTNVWRKKRVFVFADKFQQKGKIRD
jgi:hypothetical protein